MFDLKLTDGDLVLEQTDLVLVEGAEELAQCARVVLGTNKGEWFLNPDLGLDFHAFLGKQVTDTAVIEAVRNALAQEERIVSVDAVTVSRSGRQLGIAVAMTGEDGEVEVMQDVG